VNFFEAHTHPTEGALNVAKFPIRFAESPVNIRRLAPNLGEHNADFLQPAEPAEAPPPGEPAT
jgi:crotonobetainyl-CoA:carnitine CoA-transferase CaiB-like acyl-CoA transferase